MGERLGKLCLVTSEDHYMMTLIWSRNFDVLTADIKRNPESMKRFSVWLRALLRNTSLQVTFVKKDNTVREMNCTLDPELVPEIDQTAESFLMKNDVDHIVVWDLDKDAWRTIIYEAIQSIRLEPDLRSGEWKKNRERAST